MNCRINSLSFNTDIFLGPVIVPPVIRPAGPGNHIVSFVLFNFISLLTLMFLSN